jgi:short-subunit dehydrogenase
MNTVVITGGAGGIGREFSKLFAKDGYRVVVFGLLPRELESLQEELRGICPSTEILTQAIDLALPDAAEQVVAWCEARSIEIDVLVNNVGFGLLGEHVELDIGQVPRFDCRETGDRSQLVPANSVDCPTVYADEFRVVVRAPTGAMKIKGLK